MSDLTLPVARLPGIEAVAREVLGFNPWGLRGDWDRCYGAQAPAWWSPQPGHGVPLDAHGGERIIPHVLPAGRLVAETWWDRVTHQPLPERDALHAACLYLGDLLRLCSALGVEVPAGTVPELRRATTAASVWCLWADGWRVDFVPEWPVNAEILVPAIAGITDPRLALDAIVAEVLRGR